MADMKISALPAATTPDGTESVPVVQAATTKRATVAQLLAPHTADTVDAHDASAVSVVPVGGIAATDVQAALAELDAEKAPAHTHPYDASGTAAAAVTAHEGAADPHPAYLTEAAASGTYVPLSQRGAANGVATLDVAGKVPSSQLPAIATGQTISVASQAAMLALTASQVQPGDVAIRTDQTGRRWLLADADPSLIGSWIALETPDAVTSVNGQAGAVNLAAADVGAQLADADLTAIAGLDSATAGALVTDGAGWLRKTYAQLKTALALVKADVGLSDVDNTADTAKPVSTAQQTALDLKTEEVTFTVTGTVAVATGKSRFYVEGNYTIVSVRASADTAPTGAALIVDVNKNGTTIFTTQANRPQIAAGTNSDLADAIEVASLAAGDYLKADVDQVGSTVAGADLTVTVRLRRTS